MKKILFMTAVAMFFGSHGFAAEVAGPEAPVIGDYDSDTSPDGEAPSPSEPGKKEHHKKNRKANFGALVSAEAHRLKSEGLNGKTKMGGWVSDQRRQNDSKRDEASSKTSNTSRGTPRGHQK